MSHRKVNLKQFKLAKQSIKCPQFGKSIEYKLVLLIYENLIFHYLLSSQRLH